MKFVHIGDLHLGKVLNHHSMILQQEIVMFQILEYMHQEKIPILVIAGDVYDRLVPPVDAIDLFHRFVEKAILDYHIKILMISGNHDSHERLQFANSILKQQGLIISSVFEKEIMTYEYDNVVFHLLPFVKPVDVKTYFPNDQITSYQDALKVIINHHSLDKNKINVMITHQFVASNKDSLIQSESEVILSVGGTEVIDVHLFDEYDYVALGHLHAPQSISRETVRYSGSLLRYSFDEVKQNKSVTVVEVDNGIKVDTIAFLPELTLMKYQGKCADFLDIHHSIVTNVNDYIFFELTDKSLIPNAMDQLRKIYPNVLQINYIYLNQNNEYQHVVDLNKVNEHEAFFEFYQLIRGRSLSKDTLEIVNEIMEEVGDFNETN